jgi:hypothetical protein
MESRTQVTNRQYYLAGLRDAEVDVKSTGCRCCYAEAWLENVKAIENFTSHHYVRGWSVTMLGARAEEHTCEKGKP